MKNTNDTITEDIQKIVDILEKYNIHVTKTHMNGPVALANLNTNDIDISSCYIDDVSMSCINTPMNTSVTHFKDIENSKESICAMSINYENFEDLVKNSSQIYRNFSFYGLIYDKFYYLFDNNFYNPIGISKIRGCFWGRR